VTEPDILGRQPNPVFITPSNPNPWYGTIVDGRPLTEQQMAAMAAAGLDASCELILVSRNATSREMWWPKSSPTPRYQFACPVLERLRNGRIRIISPSGLTETVDADGFAGRALAKKKGRG